jgi:hypothetical protein
MLATQVISIGRFRYNVKVESCGSAARVGGARDWPYSSFHRMVRLGVYPLDRDGDVATDSTAFGER